MVYKYHIYMCDPYDIYIIFLEGTLKKSEETKVNGKKTMQDCGLTWDLLQFDLREKFWHRILSWCKAVGDGVGRGGLTFVLVSLNLVNNSYCLSQSEWDGNVLYQASWLTLS